jgi:hypothetical protein
MFDNGRHARLTDPITSVEAAESNTIEHTSKTQLAIMAILAYESMTDTEIINAYRDLEDFGDVPRASESGIRSRRADLVEKGLVEPTGEYRLSSSGRRCNVWRLVK